MNKSWRSKLIKDLLWFAAFVALLFWLLLWVDDQPSKNHTKPNQISYQTTDQFNFEKPASDNQKQINPEEADHVYSQTKEPILANHDLTYLQLYRMHRQWQTCADVTYFLEHPDEAYHPLNQLKLKINSHHSDEPDWPTDAQVESLQRHTDRCTHLKHQITELNLPELKIEQLQSIHNRLNAQLFQHLKSTQAKTEKEQAIAHVLNLISMWQDAFYAVIQASHNSSPPQNQDTPAYLVDLLEIEPQVTAYNNTGNQAIDVFSTANEQLSQQLYSADPDVFYQAQITLEQSIDVGTFGYFPFKNVGHIKNEQLLTAYISPSAVLMQLANVHDSEWFDLVIQHATLLYLCELGADCGPNSQLINYYCHASLYTMDPVSCDLDYPTFLQSHYLNDNQWSDVQYILSLIRDLYAQN